MTGRELFSGEIRFSRALLTCEWQQIVNSRSELRAVECCRMLDPVSGTNARITSPPNLIASFHAKCGSTGVIRVSVLMMLHIGFQGSGKTFLSLVEQLANKFDGEIEFY